MANPRSSTQITNRDATPPLLNDPALGVAQVRRMLALVLCVTSDAANSAYRFFQLPSNAVISSLKLWSDALSASTTLDVGVSDTTANGGATVSQALFASAVAATSAVVAAEERYNALAISTAGQALWQLLGLSADPFKFYDICVYPHVTVVAGGNIVLECSYTI